MASGDQRRPFNPHTLYDVSAEEKRRMAARRELRETLKKEFEKKVTRPNRAVGDYFFDPAVQRFLSMKAHYFDMFKPTPKNAAVALLTVAIPFGVHWYLMSWETDTFEHKLRTGQIAYKDRAYKSF